MLSNFETKVFKNIDEREIDGITINYQPKWIPNFYFGYAYARQFYRHATNALGDTVNIFSKNLPKQEIGSIFFRFSMPEDHSEFYGEMGLINEAPWPWKFFKEKFLVLKTKMLKKNYKNKNMHILWKRHFLPSLVP